MGLASGRSPGWRDVEAVLARISIGGVWSRQNFYHWAGKVADRYQARRRRAEEKKQCTPPLSGSYGVFKLARPAVFFASTHPVYEWGFGPHFCSITNQVLFTHIHFQLVT